MIRSATETGKSEKGVRCLPSTSFKEPVTRSGGGRYVRESLDALLNCWALNDTQTWTRQRYSISAKTMDASTQRSVSRQAITNLLTNSGWQGCGKRHVLITHDLLIKTRLSLPLSLCLRIGSAAGFQRWIWLPRRSHFFPLLSSGFTIYQFEDSQMFDYHT